MGNGGWRTVVIGSGEHLRCQDGNLVLEDEMSEIEIPISDLSSCVIENYHSSMTVPLLYELVTSGVSVIFCDSKHTPFCELSATGGHHEMAGHIMDQASWTENRKADVARQIIGNKITMQVALLAAENLCIPPELELAQKEDAIQKEGVAARQYFQVLFGNEFRRHDDDHINAMLDYGYVILRSFIDRVIYSHGYHTALGIHHYNRANRFNLSCDLMEPFRPLVDRVVYENRHVSLRTGGKKRLLELFYEACEYKGKHMMIQNAIKQYVLDVTAAMNDVSRVIGDVRFDRSAWNTLSSV